MKLAAEKLSSFDFAELEQSLSHASSREEFYDAAVNAPFAYTLACAKLQLGIMVFLVVNDQTQTIDRIALTRNELAEYTKRVSVKRFEEIKIPLNHTENIIARAIATGEPQQTSDWKYLFTPALTPKEARLNQASGGIATSFVYPLKSIVSGAAMIFSYYQYPDKLSQLQHTFMDRYVGIVDKTLRQR